jgi:pimeloyl-ACP methyl ester carboxylesterase
MKRNTLILTIALVAILSAIAILVFRNKAAITDQPSLERPQEPAKPYAYISEEVSFQNSGANIALSGILTLPAREGNYPAVVLISGSGPQNRDAELFGHKPFLVISDYLTKQGIAVLRYDDRGFGKSTGDFSKATALDFASDVESALVYLKTRKEINPRKIGLVGHSEGGMIAPMVAARSQEVGFMILLAGPGIQGDSLLLMQQQIMQRALGVPETDIKKLSEINTEIIDIIVNTDDPLALKAKLTKHSQENYEHIPTSFKPANVTKEQFIAAQVEMISSPWYQFILKYNPAPALEQVSCPVLALNGTKDLQIPATLNLTAIHNALRKGGNNNVQVRELPDLNHFFQECETGLPTEYATIKQTFSPVALAEISEWIWTQVK